LGSTTRAGSPRRASTLEVHQIMSNEELVNTQMAIMLATYLASWSYILGSLIIGAVLFNFRRTAIVLGFLYALVIFVTPYRITTGLGLLLLLLYVGIGVTKLVKHIRRKIHARGP